MPRNPRKQFGQRIKDLRVAQGVTQEELSDRVGVFRTYMSRIETGVANPTLTMIYALAGALKVSVPSLFEEAVAASEDQTSKTHPVSKSKTAAPSPARKQRSA